MSGLNTDHMKARFGYDKLTNWGIVDKEFENIQGRLVNVRGKESEVYANPLLRIREDKLRSMKRALYNSYQSAIIQFDKDDRQLHFRCLINHDKLKVDYEDKILSIPFKEIPVEYEKEDMELEEKIVDVGTGGRFLDEAGNPVIDEETGEQIYAYRVKPGDTFKWISGNEGYMPDSYWIIFLQYSQETAYFRGQIRKADDIIQIVPIGEDGEAGDPVEYHGWTVGPNEEQDIWNVKKGVVWNDLYYHKLLYITKDETTEAFFKRFDRVVVNGQTWEVVGYNDNYGTSSKNVEGGMIRVALKETYTSTDEQIKQYQQEVQQKIDAYTEPVIEDSEEEVVDVGIIIGPTVVESFDVIKYSVVGFKNENTAVAAWEIPQTAPVKVLQQTATQLKLEIGQVNSEVSFDIEYIGTNGLTVKVKPFK